MKENRIVAYCTACMKLGVLSCDPDKKCEYMEYAEENTARKRLKEIDPDWQQSYDAPKSIINRKKGKK